MIHEKIEVTRHDDYAITVSLDFILLNVGIANERMKNNACIVICLTRRIFAAYERIIRDNYLPQRGVKYSRYYTALKPVYLKSSR